MTACWFVYACSREKLALSFWFVDLIFRVLSVYDLICGTLVHWHMYYSSHWHHPPIFSSELSIHNHVLSFIHTSFRLSVSIHIRSRTKPLHGGKDSPSESSHFIDIALAFESFFPYALISVFKKSRHTPRGTCRYVYFCLHSRFFPSTWSYFLL